MKIRPSSARGFTLVEIMIVVAIIALLAAVAIPNVLRGRTTANETSAVQNLRAVISSLEMYRSVQQTYPDTTTWRASMYGNDCAAATAPVPDFGPPSFCVVADGGAGSQVQGFAWTYAGAAAPAQTYTMLATPVTLNTTGTRSFYADQTGLIRHCTGTATAAQAADESTIDAQPSACD